MKVITEITRLDLVKMNFYLWPKINLNWYVLIGIFVLFFAIAAFQLISEIPLSEAIGFSLGIALIFAVGFSFFGFVFCLVMLLFMASERTGLGHHEYSISDKGLLEKTVLNEELSRWKSFMKVFKSREYIFLVKHWAAIHTFPLRSFDSDAAYDEFHSLIINHLSKAE